MKEQKRKRFVVTKDDEFYWVREDAGDDYWPARDFYFFKFFAVRRAKQLTSAENLVNGREIIVWSST